MNVPVKPIDSWSRGLRLPRKQRQHESSSKANRQLVKRNLRLPRKQRQHESSSKANRQLVKRNPPLPRKQRQHESSSKANRQLVKRNPQSNRQLVKRNSPSSSGGTDLRISSPNTSTRNGNKPNNYEPRDSSKPHFFSYTFIITH
ncbi:unnamed protein product [Protopolystoma xenopodis]|uniref:Uncharacterized protein n=1 Tax=Protopolystoma xenopodis TaxID=117903 RepID=A0A448XNI3_9PLAT|nr:unnamed protein product [Protopolystoma xenopodis]